MTTLDKTAAISSRKELDRQLEKARVAFRGAKTEYDTASAQLSSLQSQVDNAAARMSAARNAITELGGHIQTMDLSGANAIRDRGDVKTYLIDSKEYVVDKNDVNDIKMTSWKDYKNSKSPTEEMDCEDIGMAYAQVLKTIKTG